MTDGGSRPGPAQRLAAELEDDGIVLDDEPAVAALVVEELDYARRVPMFEGRRPLYGAIVLGARPLEDHDVGLDVVPVDTELAVARTYADGRSSYLVRHPERALALACFDRPLQYEADLVRLQEATGAQIIQRTPVFGVIRLFRNGSIVVWDGSSWKARDSAATLLPRLQACAPGLPDGVAKGLLHLAIHWLSPGRVGATLVVHDGPPDPHSVDLASATEPPPLFVTNRRHYPALLSSLEQRDLATFVEPDGRVRAIGVGLRNSAAADAALPGDRGMRHRSAQRWSFDHPGAVLIVVSGDGPISVYREGMHFVA